MLGLSLDREAKAWQAAQQKLNLPWQRGRLTDTSAGGVSAVPVYWLLDREGRIVVKSFDVDELTKGLAERIK